MPFSRKKTKPLRHELILYHIQLTSYKQKLIKIHSSGANASPPPDEEVKSLKYLSDGSDDFNSFQKEAKKELKQVSVELAKFRTKVNTITKAIDEICEHQLPVHC